MNSTTSTTQTTALEGGRLSSTELNFDQIWILFYIPKQSHAVQAKYFYYNGEVHQAVERSKIYCSKLGVRWIRVERFLTNFSIDESRLDALAL